MSRPPIWRNWSGAETARPRHWWKPRTERQAGAVVQEAAARGERVRVVGAGHSFNRMAAAEDHLISLDEYTGLVSVDAAAARARFRAGTRLRDIPALLRPYALALPNQGDVNPQSIAGALSTGTHGTGLGFTGFGGMVTGLRLLTAQGEVLELSPREHPELFDHARISLGALGILLEVELQCVPAFDLIAEERGLPFEQLLEGLIPHAETSDHFEAYWFPHTRRTMTKRNTRVPAGAAAPAPLDGVRPRSKVLQMLSEELLDNAGLRVICEIGARWPAAVPTLNRVAAAATSHRTYRAPAHEVFVSPRRVRFQEMEYAVPLEAGPEALREIERTVRARDWRISFPVEIRTAAADDVPLSTATGRRSCYLAVHRFFREEPGEYFREVEAICRAHGGRPHWGKRHSLQAEQLREIYPRFEEFLQVRARLDPEWMFGNAWTDRLLGR